MTFRHQLLAFAFPFYHLLVPLLLAFGHASFVASWQLLRAVFTAAAFDAIIASTLVCHQCSRFRCYLHQLLICHQRSSFRCHVHCSRLPRAAAIDPIQLPTAAACSFEFWLERLSPRHRARLHPFHPNALELWL